MRVGIIVLSVIYLSSEKNPIISIKIINNNCN